MILGRKRTLGLLIAASLTAVAYAQNPQTPPATSDPARSGQPNPQQPANDASRTGQVNPQQPNINDPGRTGQINPQQPNANDPRTGRPNPPITNDPARSGNTNAPQRLDANNNPTAINRTGFAPTNFQRSGELIGRPITTNGQTVGRVEDFVIDPATGRIVYGVNSFNDSRDRLYPTPFQASRFSNTDRSFALDIEAERLRSATNFPNNQWPDFNDDQFTTNTFRSYNQTPWWETNVAATGTTTGINNRPRDIHARDNRDVTATTRTNTGGSTTTTTVNRGTGTPTNPRDRAATTTTTTTDTAANRTARDRATLASDTGRVGMNSSDRWTQRPMTYQRMSELRGREVRAADGTSIGKISEVVVDPENGRVLYAAVEGAGNRRFPIPWSAMQSSGRDGFQISVNADRLKNAPTFESEKWPNMADQRWAEDVHRYYAVEPYWDSGFVPTDRR